MFKHKTQSYFRKFFNLINNPKVSLILKIYAICSTAVLIVGGIFFALYRYGDTTRYTYEVKTNHEILITFNRYVLWKGERYTLEPDFPVNIKCKGWEKSIRGEVFCIAKNLAITADTPFIPGISHKVVLYGVKTFFKTLDVSFEITPVPSHAIFVTSIPFVTTNPSVHDWFELVGLSETTRIEVITDPKIELNVKIENDHAIITAKNGYIPNTNYTYAINRWEEIAVTNEEASLLTHFCERKKDICPFTVSLDPPRVQTQKETVAQGAFFTPSPLEIVEITPENNATNVHIDEAITIKFNKDLNPETISQSLKPVSENISDFKFSQPDNSSIKLEPPTGKTWEYAKQYKFILTKELKAFDGSCLMNEYNINFTTIGPVKILSTSPPNGARGVSLSSSISITFDQEVDHSSAQSVFTISPNPGGSFIWTGNTLNYKPRGLSIGTKYTVNLSSGIKSIHGLPSDTNYSFSFTTTNKQVISIGKSSRGKSIYAFIFGSGKKTVLYTAGLHGNEIASINVLDKWVDYLDAHPEVLPPDTRAIVVVISNIDGYLKKERMNSNGVDLNRNWGTTDWRKDTWVRSTYYPNGGGPYPFSEPETQALKNLIIKYRVNILVDYHCCLDGVYAGYNIPKSNELAAIIRQKTGYSDSMWGDDEYDVTGSMTTWVGEALGIPSVTVEVINTNNEYNRNKEALKAILSFE